MAVYLPVCLYLAKNASYIPFFNAYFTFYFVYLNVSFVSAFSSLVVKVIFSNMTNPCQRLMSTLKTEIHDTHTHTHIHTLAQTYTHTHTHTMAHTHTHTHKVFINFIRRTAFIWHKAVLTFISFTLTHTHTHTHIPTHAYTYTHTHRERGR